jgi:hypothetical protein
MIELCVYKATTKKGEVAHFVPTHFIFRPSDLEELGLTAGEISKMIKENT